MLGVEQHQVSGTFAGTRQLLPDHQHENVRYQHQSIRHQAKKVRYQQQSIRHQHHMVSISRSLAGTSNSTWCLYLVLVRTSGIF